MDSGYPNRVGYPAPFKGSTYHILEFWLRSGRPPQGKYKIFIFLHSSLRNVIERASFWAKLGDVGTKKFHANATIRHRGNLITQLKSRDGSTLTSHKDKELLMISKKGRERLNLLGLPLTHHCCWREGIT